MPDQFKMWMTGQMFDIAPCASKKIIDAKNDRTVCQQALTQVRT